MASVVAGVWRRTAFACGVATAMAAGLVPSVGCGNNYRPVVSAINPVGPAAQPQKFAVAVSDPGGGLPGILTLVDVSGDTILVVANLDPAPVYFDLFGASNGGTGYSLHRSGSSSTSTTTMNNFDVSPSLKTNAVFATTLFPDANANTVVATSAGAYVTEPGRSAVGQIIGGSPAALKQEFTVAANPTYTVGISGAPRYFVLSRGTGTVGQAASIDTTENTISGTIALGNNPVYGVMSSDFKRVFTVNEGSGTVNVINAQTNLLDTSANIPSGTITVGSNPVWADIANTINELLVVNSGNGTTAGSVSIINIPLCNASAQISNPTCDQTNPADAASFGQTIATVPVGINPTMISVLQDGTRAYVMCQDDPTSHDANNGVVYVINLSSNTVTAKVKVIGHPNWITAITGTPKGKVYTTASDSHQLSIIDTQTDTFLTSIDLQGNGIAVRRNLN